MAVFLMCGDGEQDEGLGELGKPNDQLVVGGRRGREHFFSSFPDGHKI